MERAIPCELPFFYFRSAQFNSSKNITFVPNLQEIFKVVKRTFLYINLVIALFFVLPVSQAKEKTFTVVIDAGHGGKDPGARGSSINEKAINLAVALRLGSLISEKHDDVKVIYTRKTDVFIELDERANIANRNKADLFISIHTNAVKRGSSVSGTETYTLGLARTDENLEVAMRENSAILLEDNYLQKYEGFDPTSSESYIIFEFMQNKHMEQSISLASEVQKCFASAKRNNRGVRQAGFLVLRKTSMPSILVELGYISNPAEERFMRTKEGQNKPPFIMLLQNISGSMTASAVRWREMQVLLLYWKLQIILMIINRFLRLLEAKSIFAKRTRWRSPTRVACLSRQSPRSKRVGLKRGKRFIKYKYLPRIKNFLPVLNCLKDIRMSITLLRKAFTSIHTARRQVSILSASCAGR